MPRWWATNTAGVKLFRTRFQNPYVPTSQHRDQSKIGIASQIVLFETLRAQEPALIDENTQLG